MPRRRLAFAAFAAACSCLSAAAAAFGPADAKLVGVRFGFDGMSPPERWSPLVVTIQPGEKAQSLEVTVEYPQDSTQTCVLSAPVATTPGRETTVPLLVCLPQSVGRIEVTLKRDGTAISRGTFARSPGRDEQPTPPQTESGTVVIGALDVRVRPELLKLWTGEKDPNGYSMTMAEPAAILKVRATDLTQTWAGFDSLNILVTRQSTLDRLPTGTLDALATWVSSGGRLILITDSAGPTWKRFVPTGVLAGDFEPVEPPATLQLEGLITAKPAQRISARPLTVAPSAAARGWRTGQTLDDHGALIASGPFGGGITLLVGADPTLLTAELNDAALDPLWQSLVRRVAPDMLAHPLRNRYAGVSSGDGPAAEAALRSAVDSVCDVPAVPGFVYTLIVVLAVGLTLAVSIVDFFVLGKLRSRHRSWLTAAAWTLLCATAAWVLPNIVRGRDTSLGRLAVIDALPQADPQTPSVWQTGVTTLFAASSGEVALRATGNPKQTDTSGYWRGVSVVETYSYRSSQRTSLVGDLPLRQHISALDGSAAAVTLPDRGMPVRQWTLRTLHDHGPASSTPTAVFVVAGDRGGFEIAGLPKGARITSAAAQQATGWSLLTAETPTGGKTRLKVSSSATDSLPPWHQKPPPIPGDEQQRAYTYPSYNESPPASFLYLDGARRRTAAFDAMAATGDYAVVHLRVDAPSDITTPMPHRSRSTFIYRIAVPITQQAPLPPQQTTPDTP
ncbi:MAG: hypothetical protein QM783_17610 [Phycisphaerales bacterium]